MLPQMSKQPFTVQILMKSMNPIMFTSHPESQKLLSYLCSHHKKVFHLKSTKSWFREKEEKYTNEPWLVLSHSVSSVADGYFPLELQAVELGWKKNYL